MAAVATQKIGPYQIIRPIGRGGMGRVFLGVDTREGKKVAIKILPEKFLEDKKKSEYLRHELKIAKELNHPNVVDVYEILELRRKADGKLQSFMVMEYIDGNNLRTLIDSKSLMFAECLNICEQMCAGLNYMHRHLLKDGRYHSTIHRDIKPENVIVGNDGTLKIVDFGLSLEEKPFSFFTSKSRAGTPRYMSPEQIRGKTVDERSDIYSFGLCMYELFTGCFPYDGNGRKEIMKKHVTRKIKPEDPSRRNKKLPPALCRISLEGLSGDRKASPQGGLA